MRIEEDLLFLRSIVEGCHQLGINYLSGFLLLSEKWKRPVGELKAILRFMEYYLKIKEICCKKWCLQVLSPFMQKLIQEVEDLTANNRYLRLKIAFSYCGRNDICKLCKKLVEKQTKECIQLMSFLKILQQNFYIHHLGNLAIWNFIFLINIGQILMQKIWYLQFKIQTMFKSV
ncbi:unnamed protein product (macronuclear) [Paramecium tetraurelia]|uniref:Uncharacterized protein n=1 Tax=Paramecium tetraurelia TaxID=5888 RepID=A0BGE2_PARTE|nr:uncharacterized protein GSPATT00028644001 [Paramecium tetraurelia]CAK57609.1 unnamed protein product [Paramecium tetraurelia]|eukprot:XP_001425007.1 hypothetical protein (macronuclear) [Paramecium tetraurelia strain d4-2]